MLRSLPSTLPALLPLVLPLLLLCAAAPARAAQDAPSEETVQYFKLNCTSCHTIGGGRLTGPDLKNVEERRERAWLTEYLQDPKAVLDRGEPYSQELLRAARGVYMPAPPGMTRARAAKLLDLIAVESALEKSQFVGLQISDRPLTEVDVAAGRALFLGRARLQGGGTACISCHTLGGLGGFGGGRLGPDLTGAYARLEGRKALAAWLSAPPALVMQPVFGDKPLDGEEVLALVAFLKQAAESGVTEAPPRALAFVLSAIGLATVLLMSMDFLWRRRFRTVRRRLVAGSA